MEATDFDEHIHEPHHDAEHHEPAGHEGLRKFAGIYLGVIAMLLAIASLGGGAATREMLSANIHASDTYAQYQAKYLRQVHFRTTADILETMGGEHAPNAADGAKVAALIKSYRDAAARYDSEPDSGDGKKELLAKAKQWEARRDHAAAQDPIFEFAGALLQIAIVLGSVSIVAASRWLLGLSSALAACGVLMTLNGFLLMVPLPH